MDILQFTGVIAKVLLSSLEDRCIPGKQTLQNSQATVEEGEFALRRLWLHKTWSTSILYFKFSLFLSFFISVYLSCCNDILITSLYIYNIFVSFNKIIKLNRLHKKKGLNRLISSIKPNKLPY